MKTRKKKKVRGKRSAKTTRSRKNPLRMDPTRTATLRRAFTNRVKKQFARLRFEIVKLVVDEDAFGLNGPNLSMDSFLNNAFCPGEYRDPSCSPGGEKSVILGDGSKSAPYKCGDDVKLAAKLLANGHHVELAQREGLSTLTKKMSKMINKAVESGKPPPKFDLCKVSVPDTNVFCQETVGVPRINMPQMRGQPKEGSLAALKAPVNKEGKVDIGEEFISHLKESGVEVEEIDIRASFLRASQSEIDGGRVVELVNKAGGGKDLRERPIYVTRDNYVLDGHHHWAALVALGGGRKDYKVPVFRLDVDIGRGITMANDFARHMGLKPKTVAAATANAFCPTGEGGGIDPSCGVGESIASSLSNIKDISERDRDLAEELMDNGAKITKRGEVILYHRTSEENAAKVKSTGKMTGKENGLFFSTSESGQAEGFGGAVIKMKVPLSRLELDDVFGGEAHVRIPMKRAGQVVDVGKMLVTTNAFCPTGEGGGIDPSCSPGGIKTTIDVKLERKYHGRDFDSPEEGEMETYRIALKSDTGETVSHAALMISRGTGVGRISDLKTTEKYRKQGHASNLYREMVKIAREKGVKELYSDTNRKEATNKIWEKLGATKFKAPEGNVYRLVLNSAIVNAFCDTGDLTTNAGRWRFESNPDKIRQFKEWLKKRMGDTVKGKTEEEIWEAYTRAGFEKGAGRAWDDTKKTERARAASARDRREKLDFYQGTKDQFLRSSFGRPVSVEKVQLLAGRAFDDLDGVTADMATRMSRTLTDGLVMGQGPREIARSLADDVEIGRERALLIARTEIIRAHAEGQLQALDDLGVEEVGVAVEWSTAGDERVCHLCEPLEGLILKIDEARGMLPRHPNCLLPGNIVQGRFTAALKAGYSGKAVEIRTVGGSRFSLTVNHPILTKHGFVRAGEINKGDYLVGYFSKVKTVLTPHVEYSPTTVEEVFDSLASVSSKKAVPGFDLYGDEKSVVGEIEVVRPNLLVNELVTSQRQRVDNVVLVDSNVRHQRLTSSTLISPLLRSHPRPFNLLGGALSAHSDSSLTQPPNNRTAVNAEPFGKCIHGFTRRVEAADSLKVKSAIQSIDLRFGHAANLDIPFNKPAFESVSLDTDLATQLLHRFSGEVSLDQVVDVRTFHYEGSVYDLESPMGYFTTGGGKSSTVVKNCRCAWMPANVGETDEGQKDSKREIERSIRTSQKLSGEDEDEGWGSGEPISRSRPEGIFNTQALVDLDKLMSGRREIIENAFCPTGEGGGIDPTCASGSGAIRDKTGKEWNVTHRVVSSKHVYSLTDPEDVKNQIGVATLSEDKKSVSFIGINPGFEGKGIAKSLYNHIEKHLGYRLLPNSQQTEGGKALWKSRENKK